MTPKQADRLIERKEYVRLTMRHGDVVGCVLARRDGRYLHADQYDWEGGTFTNGAFDIRDVLDWNTG